MCTAAATGILSVAGSCRPAVAAATGQLECRPARFYSAPAQRDGPRTALQRPDAHRDISQPEAFHEPANLPPASSSTHRHPGDGPGLVPVRLRRQAGGSRRCRRGRGRHAGSRGPADSASSTCATTMSARPSPCRSRRSTCRKRGSAGTRSAAKNHHRRGAGRLRPHHGAPDHCTGRRGADVARSGPSWNSSGRDEGSCRPWWPWARASSLPASTKARTFPRQNKPQVVDAVNALGRWVGRASLPTSGAPRRPLPKSPAPRALPIQTLDVSRRWIFDGLMDVAGVVLAGFKNTLGHYDIDIDGALDTPAPRPSTARATRRRCACLQLV